MKKILAAWIQQVLVFPNQKEYQDYIKEIERKSQQYEVVSCTQTAQGETKVNIRKQYNNNAFRDVERKGE